MNPNLQNVPTLEWPNGLNLLYIFVWALTSISHHDPRFTWFYLFPHDLSTVPQMVGCILCSSSEPMRLSPWNVGITKFPICRGILSPRASMSQIKPLKHVVIHHACNGSLWPVLIGCQSGWFMARWTTDVLGFFFFIPSHPASSFQDWIAALKFEILICFPPNMCRQIFKIVPNLCTKKLLSVTNKSLSKEKKHSNPFYWDAALTLIWKWWSDNGSFDAREQNKKKRLSK